MDKKIIRGNLQKLLAINATENPMNVNLALGLIGAYMLKSVTTVLREWTAMETFFKYLQSKCFNGNKRSIIRESSFSDCTLYIKSFISSQPFAEKRKTIMSLELKLITEVNDDGYLSFNDKTFNAYASQKTIDDKSANNYIVVDNAINAIEDNDVEGPEERDVNTDMQDNFRNQGSEENNMTDVGNNAVEDEGEQEETETDIDNVSLKGLKEFLLSTFQQYPLGLKQYPYFWQYKLNQDQYWKLRKILLDLDLKRHKGVLRKEPCGTGLGTVACAVALFISEWYKRESTSLRGDHCLRDLGLSGDSSLIWKGAAFPVDYLHKEDINDREMRQTAMCALGGLPLDYVKESNRFRSFVEGLFILNNKEEDITDEDIESIVDCFDDNNRLFKRSLKSGSCKEYLIKLVDYLENGNIEDLPFAESDMGNSPFAGFIKRLQDGYDDALPKNFFQKEIRIWTYDFMEEDDESNLIESEFYAHIGFFKSNNVITTRELSKLGIVLPPEASMFDACLKITMRDGSCIIKKDEKRIYHKIGNHCDDFCGAFGSSLAVSIDLFKTKDIALLIESGDYCKEIHLYTIPSYLEFYATDNGFQWTTKTNNAAQKVVFYDKSIYTPENEDNLDIQTKSFEENNWGWIYLTEAIKLIDSTGRIITIGLEESELIMVDFKVKSLRKVIELSKDGCVECVIQDDDIREIPLLYLDDKKRPMLSCDGMRGNDLLKNYKIEFKTTSDHYYSEWTTNNVPPQGFLSIRLSCRDESMKKKQRKFKVYFIPGTYPIVKRNLDNNYIYIKGEKVCVLDESLKNNLSPVDGEFKYRYKDDCYDLDFSSISFRIGDEENHIVLKTYRAFNWTRILNNGKTIKDITNDGSEKPPVALIRQKNIHLQVVNEEGYKIYSPCYQRYLDYFRDPMDLAFVKRGKKLSSFYIDETSQPFLYYVYISSFDDNGKIRKIEKKKDDNGNEFVLLNVSEDYINEYVLCYWSGEQQDNPVRIEPAKQSERLYCFNLPSPLQRKAVVFQSLSDCSPNLYFRPFYADENWSWSNYVQRYGSVSIDFIIKCYQLAVEHNVYFGVFPAIRNLQKRDLFSKFIRGYAHLKNYSFSRKDEINLTRLAKELSMDWYFADSNILYDRDENHNKRMKECMKVLMHTSPVAKAFQVKDNKLCKSLEKAYKKYKKDFDGCDNTNNRIELLNQFAL